MSKPTRLFLPFTYPCNGHVLDYRFFVEVNGSRWRIRRQDVRCVLKDGAPANAPDQLKALDVFEAEVLNSKTLLELVVAEVKYQRKLGVIQ